MCCVFGCSFFGEQVSSKTSPPAPNSVNGSGSNSSNGGSANGSANGSVNGSVNGSDANPAVRVGVLFAGRQASGGHNIIWGLHEYLKGTGSTVSLFSFFFLVFLACFHGVSSMMETVSNRCPPPLPPYAE